MGLELLIIVLLVLLNGFFAMAEMALVASRRAKLKVMARRNSGARMALKLSEHPSRFLSTVQVGITLIGVLAGAFGGATLAESVAEYFRPVAVLADYADAIAVALVVIGITMLSLILGELVPKRLALANPERVAARVSGVMRVLTFLMTPAIAVLATLSNLVIRLLGLKAETAAKVTEEEIRHMVQEGAETGAILSVERDMVNRVFRLGDKLVDDIMTARPQIVWLDMSDSREDNLARMRGSRFSRYPVLAKDSDECVGIVRAKDIAFEMEQGLPVDIFAKMRPPLFVPQQTPALAMLDQFKKAGLHMALVVDEYGEVKGLITPTDLLEAIVGEMAAKPGDTASSIVRRADGSLLVDAQMAADELKEALALSELPGEAEHDYNTVAGLILAQLEHIPREGESFDWRGLRFEVIDMDGRRIDKVLITKLSGTAPGEAAA